MRVNESNKDISVRAVAGTEVILFGMNVPDDKAKGLLGFKIEKQVDDDWKQLHDGRTFETSSETLIQRFMWSDYSVDAGNDYVYRFTAVYGSVSNFKYTDTLELKITTENPDDGENAIYFNRGVAGSQAYARKFGAYRKRYKENPTEQDPEKIRYVDLLKPEDVPDRAAYKWLSRGLEEALLAFIGQAKDKTYSIRASLYELSHKPAAQAFVDALERGVDVKIIHHAKLQTTYDRVSNKDAVTSVAFKKDQDPRAFWGSELQKNKIPDSISTTAMRTLGSIGVSDTTCWEAYKQMLIPRSKANISHNKFIILLKDGKPIQVWTGSTNLTGGGLFGQSNVGQIIRNEDIAEQYHNYWNKLSGDPDKKKSDTKDPGIKNWLETNNPDLPDDLPKDSVNVIFSPRLSDQMLQWYADRLNEAKDSVFLTLAFSIDESFAEVVKNNSAHTTSSNFLRYLMLEDKNAQYIKPRFKEMTDCKQNHVAWGDKLDNRENGVSNDFIETLTGLNNHVNYLHTKYMIIDALTDDPIVISGSANFSNASTVDNDENMLIFRGNTRIADIYMTEFMRMFNHFRARNESNALSDEEFEKGEVLDPSSDWVEKYFTEGSSYQRERLLFGTKQG